MKIVYIPAFVSSVMHALLATATERVTHTLFVAERVGHMLLAVAKRATSCNPVSSSVAL